MAYNVKMMIKNETDKDKTLATTIAKKMGYADRTSLYKFLNEPKRICRKFAGLAEVVKDLFGDIHHQVMSDYAKTLDFSKEAARSMLEYANLNRLDELQAYLINKMSSPKCGDINRDLARAYQLDIDAQNGKENILNEINTFDSRFEEPRAFRDILKMYYYYDNQHISMLKEHLSISQSSIANIKVSTKSDVYLKNSYENRLALAMMGAYISNGEVEKCRSVAETMLAKKYDNNIDVVSYLQLGNSYLFEDYKKALGYFQNGLELIALSEKDSAYEVQIKRSINFLNVYWNKQVSFITDAGSVTDLHNTVHNAINKGDYDKAKKLLEAIDYEAINNIDKGFHKYYESIVLDKKECLYESAFYFKEAGKKNYCKLPLSKLKALGESEMQLKLYVS